MTEPRLIRVLLAERTNKIHAADPDRPDYFLCGAGRKWGPPVARALTSRPHTADSVDCKNCLTKLGRNPVIPNQCLGSGYSSGGGTGGRASRRRVCPVCGRVISARPGRAGRLYPHKATEGGTR